MDEVKQRECEVRRVERGIPTLLIESKRCFARVSQYQKKKALVRSLHVCMLVGIYEDILHIYVDRSFICDQLSNPMKKMEEQ